ncbi:MAG TPA: dihydroorotase [Microthrixaceae bacterium]|nr:dihydroorotase [Microthrixaceae bacterium]
MIKGGRVLDAGGERPADVVVSNGRIAAVGADLDAEVVLDAGGCLVTPGLVDLHTHLREPGREEAETVESGARAAALGGYTAVLAMPNTTPTMDSAAVVREVLELGRSSVCDVHASGAITVDRAGEQLAPMAEMAALGVRLFTDDGTGVQDDRLMRRALEYAAGLGVTLAQHCEVSALSAGTCMHEGEWSARLGLPGQPAEAEELMVARDIALARLTGARMHFLHLSTAGSVALVAAAKASGLAVTAEAAPHHFTLTDACCAGYDATFKVHPPLRPDVDVDAVAAGLADGTIDAIATDHAPHPLEEKERPFDQAPPGMLGLEYALALALTRLVDGQRADVDPDRPDGGGVAGAAGPYRGQRLSDADVIARLSWQPAAIAGMEDHGGPIEQGRAANLCVVDTAHRWTIDGSGGASRSRNVPYVGLNVRGRVRHTVCRGEPVVVDGEVQR